MQSPVRTPIFLLLVCLILTVLNLGCGGGGLPASSQLAQTAQSTAQSMQSPMLGFVSTNNGNEVRAILGVPGASVLSNPLAIPPGVTNLYFAPGQKYAIVAESPGSPVGVLTFPTSTPGPVVEISGAISQPDIVSFSPSGAAAALYSSSQGTIEVVSGLPSTPHLAFSISSTDLPNAIGLIALADDGTTLLGGTANSSVYRLVAGSAPLMVDTVGDLEGVAFVPQSQNALIFDRNNSSLSLLQNVNGSASASSLVGGLTGLGGKITLQVAAGLAMVTGTSSNQLWQINLQNSHVQSQQLPATATTLQPLRTSGKYLVSWQSGQPAWIVDTSGQAGAVFFVPANIDAGSHP